MEIIKINEFDDKLINELLAIWKSAVRATHHFLDEEAILNIKAYVPDAFKGVKDFYVLDDDGICAFMGINDDFLEMLFVNDKKRGQGLGRKLLEFGIDKGVKRLSVNEDNPSAVGFYKHMGFKIYDRKDTDDNGDPYPLLYMEL